MARVYGGNEWPDKFSNVPFEDFNERRQPRYYQQLAVSNAVQAIAEEKLNALLLLRQNWQTFIAFKYGNCSKLLDAVVMASVSLVHCFWLIETF